MKKPFIIKSSDLKIVREFTDTPRRAVKQLRRLAAETKTSLGLFHATDTYPCVTTI